jgi:sugar/nucleoside kinase (ribokinase family)
MAMAKSPTLVPRLDLLFDHRTPWSAEKFAEAIKLHAVLLWPHDGPRQNQHAAVVLARHRKQARRIVSAEVGYGFLRYSEMKEKIEKDLDVLHGSLMSKGDMRRMFKERVRDKIYANKRLKQIDSMNLVVKFIEDASPVSSGRSTSRSK